MTGKAKIILVIWAFLSGAGYSQVFLNLNFEASTIGGADSDQFALASNAIPGWTAYIGGISQSTIWYNDVPLSAAEVTLQSSNNIHGWPPPVQGKYCVMLWGNFNPSQGSFYTNSAAIGQTGQIPPWANTITFWGTLGGMQASFAGHSLNFIQSGTAVNYNIYTADISNYAGQTGELLFDDPFYYTTYTPHHTRWPGDAG